jgi:hypothetical protein
VPSRHHAAPVEIVTRHGTERGAMRRDRNSLAMMWSKCAGVQGDSDGRRSSRPNMKNGSPKTGRQSNGRARGFGGRNQRGGPARRRRLSSDETNADAGDGVPDEMDSSARPRHDAAALAVGFVADPKQGRIKMNVANLRAKRRHVWKIRKHFNRLEIGPM